MSCFLEAVSYLVIRPLSLTKHRKVCLFFTRAFLLSAPFILEHWAKIKFKGYGDRIDPTKSHFAVINHRSNIDWLLGLAYISRLGAPYPGNAKSVVKASLAKVPIFGYILRFAEFLFLTRSWATDKDQFLKGLERLKGYSKSVSPMWMVLYPEGTRFSKQRHDDSTAFALSKGLSPTQNVLLPRFKGFTSTVSVLRGEFDGIVDATFMFEGDEPDVKSSLAGTCSSVVHCHMKYFLIEEIPESEEELTKWLLDRWYEKDRLITAFKKDIGSLGPAIETSDKPSVSLFYVLVVLFQIAAATTIYGFSKIPNGLFFLFGVSLGAVGLTGLFVAMNIKPSRRGPTESKKQQ